MDTIKTFLYILNFIQLFFFCFLEYFTFFKKNNLNYLIFICFLIFVALFSSGSSALAKLKTGGSGGPLKQQGEKKETPQERLKRIMNKQLNKQSMAV